MGSNLTSYLTQGLCPEFYRGLEKLVGKLYWRYEVNDSFEVFHEAAREKIEDILMAGVYDPAKSNFISFLYSMIRNEATKINSKNRKVDTQDVYEYLDLPGGAHAKAPDSLQSLYFSRRAELGICPDESEFGADIHTRTVTPDVLAYLWLCKSGRIHGWR